MFGWMMVEVCDANPAACKELFDLEEAYPGLSVLETSCMSECELCAARPYVFVNGARMDAPTVDALLQAVRKALDNELEADKEDI